LYADSLLFWVVGEPQSEVPVDLRAVGGLDFGKDCGYVAELLEERVDLVPGHGPRPAGVGRSELLLDLAPLVQDLGVSRVAVAGAGRAARPW
jgi:hypothetical protein